MPNFANMRIPFSQLKAVLAQARNKILMPKTSVIIGWTETQLNFTSADNSRMLSWRFTPPPSCTHVCDVYVSSVGCGFLTTFIIINTFRPSWKRQNLLFTCVWLMQPSPSYPYILLTHLSCILLCTPWGLCYSKRRSFLWALLDCLTPMTWFDKYSIGYNYWDQCLQMERKNRIKTTLNWYEILVNVYLFIYLRNIPLFVTWLFWYILYIKQEGQCIVFL